MRQPVVALACVAVGSGSPSAPIYLVHGHLGPTTLELAVHEGRKHQVKRMLGAVGHPVMRLHRSRYAGLTLKGLGPGEWRELAGPEVESLRRLVF